jgi:tRNA threonylcarbamoyl adenosine modification protein YeaZ
MLLFLDTSDFKETKIALVGKEIVWHKFAAHDLSERLLPEIRKFCKRQKIALNQIDKIAVVEGPGSFSKIRTGVATANALALGLGLEVVPIKANVPVDLRLLVSKRGQKLAKPYYAQKPSITLPRNH